MQKFFSKIDWVLLCTALFISAGSLLTLYNFSDPQIFFYKQLVFILLSVCLFFIVSQIDLQIFKNSHIAFYLYVGLIFVLVTLFLVGHTVKGAQSWFNLGGFSFQPTDLMKIATILVCAKYFSRRHVEIKRFKHVLVSLVYMFIPFILIFLQPDFGSAIILFFIWFGMILLSGLSKKHLLVFFCTGLLLFGILWGFVFKEYQKNRVRNFINPTLDVKGSGYNAKQAIIAVGSGQLIGKGVGYGTQSRLNFLPEYQTDFIFAAYGEELGFVGSVFVILLYGLLLIRIISISLRGSGNFEILIGLGVAIFFLAHIVINIGMNIGIMPITGITLPFMSYGGSHLIAEFIALGLINSIYRNKRATHRENLNYEFLGVE